MKTTTTLTIPHTGSRERKKPFLRIIYNNLLTEFKRGQSGYATIAIIGQSCIGSAAAMLLLMSDLATFPKMSLLFLVTILCMNFNGAVLAQLKPKIIFNILIISVLFNCSIIFALIL